MIITRTIGIDLGTTNSAVAMLEMDDQTLLLCKDSQGRSTMPSCVWLDSKSGDIIVGHRAYARKGTTPEPICSIKRSMGTQMTVDLGNEQYTPAEISAYLLKALKAQMETELSSRITNGLSYEVSNAIITVPAYFGLPAIEATREAGKLAELEVTELLHEPTAAAIYYSWKHNLDDGIYLVYDLGGGTFDVSILQRTSGEFLVLGISGDNFLGGDDFDRRLAEHIRTLLVADDYDLELDVTNNSEDKLRFNQLMTLAERVKKELSNKEEYILRDQGTIKDKSGIPVIIETAITRATFESLIEDLLDRTIESCKTALSRAEEKGDITLDNIDHILLTGGSTYVPAVLEKVKQAFCQNDRGDENALIACAEPIRDDPENAVALGAALRAAASGLGIGDDEKRLRAWFRGSSITKRDEANISGHIELLLKDLYIQDGHIRITDNQGEELGDVQLKSGLKFVFPKLSLQTETLNEFCFEIFDKTEQQIAVLQRSIVHASDLKEMVGSTLSTSVLPKPIILEGTDGDRLIRQTLLANGTSLPANAKFIFAVNDPSGHIRLPIYQENRIIKELQADVGIVTVGTPVEIEINCDEQVNIHVIFSIGDQNFGGKIAPPPPDAVPTDYEIQQITSRFNDALQTLDEEDANRLIALYESTYQDFVEAHRGADYPKVIQKAKDLDGLVREARLAEPLRPPLDALESNYAKCLELYPNAVEMKSELARSSLKADIENTIEKARKAYKQRDQEEYTDAVQMINTSLQFLVTLTKVRQTDNKDVDTAMRAFLLLDQCRQMIQFLLINRLITNKTDYITDLKNQMDEVDKLEEEVNADPVKVTNRCQVIITEMQRTYQEIMPEDKIGKELSGLLKVDSQRQSADVGATDNLFPKL